MKTLTCLIRLGLGFGVFFPHVVSTPDSSFDIFDPVHYGSADVITRDVAIIGGGSSGTYGAVNLAKLGQSVVLIEKEALLGGHTNSYKDPATGTTLDYGVQAFWNISVTRDYFAYLDVPVSEWAPLPRTLLHADFKTGQPVTVRTSSDYSGYAAQLGKYPYLEWSWSLPHPVPADLLLHFEEFVAKYNLGDVAYNIYFNGQGFSDILQQLTANVFKIVDGSFLDALSGGDVATSNHDNAEIYTKAQALLGPDNVLLSSTIVSAWRPLAASSDAVRLVVRTPTGKKLIKASKLLISIPPLLENMQPFDLDAKEHRLFSQWQHSGYYTMLVNNTGLPSGSRFVNAVASKATYNIPPLPAPYQITETAIPGLFYVWYGSPHTLTRAEVKSDVVEVIKRLRGTAVNSSMSATGVTAESSLEPQFVAFRNHTPFKLVVPAEAISTGFYHELEGLQGRRNTWYTGAAFLSHSSAILWNFTQSLLPDIISS